MLEQRRAREKGYITLKEAAEIAGYTPDYVGQLIRAGKLKGEQVYSSVAWVTTEEELNTYLLHKGRLSRSESQLLFFELPIFKVVLYMLIASCVVTILLLQYIFYISIDSKLSEHALSSITIQQEQSS